MSNSKELIVDGFVCDVEGCGKEWKSAKALSDHKRIVHSSPIACPRGCDAKLKPHYVARHVREVHDGVRPAKVACPDCRKLFASCNLDRHIRIHTRLRPFSCRFCDKSFAQSGACTSHEDAIHLHRRYFCLVDNCTTSFTLCSNGIAHLKNVHNITSNYSTHYQLRDTARTAAALASLSTTTTTTTPQQQPKRQRTRTPTPPPQPTAKPAQPDEFGENGAEIVSVSI